jgi:hypothetical protein
MQRLGVSGAVRPLLGSLGVKGLINPVSNIGSHGALYALIIPHIFECWPEDGLIKPKHVAAIKY